MSASLQHLVRLDRIAGVGASANPDKIGIHRAAALEELYDFAKALAYLPAPPGPRTLIVVVARVVPSTEESGRNR